MNNTEQSMGINDGGANACVSPNAPVSPSLKAAPTAGGVTAPGVLTFSKEDLVYLATDATSTIGVRRSAAEALYTLGQRDGAREMSDATRKIFEPKEAQS